MKDADLVRLPDLGVGVVGVGVSEVVGAVQKVVPRPAGGTGRGGEGGRVRDERTRWMQRLHTTHLLHSVGSNRELA